MNAILTININDPLYPEALKAIGEDAPAIIYALGNTDLLSRENKVAIIGSRKCSRRGWDGAYKLGIKYAKMGYVVVSGLALGCDSASHNGCLDAKGETIAIVGNGLDICHPAENKDLMQRILDNGGLILSEQPVGTKACRSTLVARNRLQAALADKVIVAECPYHSGTMHTVRFAGNYGKPVTAVRYKIWNGTNTGNQHIIEDLGTEETI